MSESTGRGAQRRAAQREQKAHQIALGWWRQPAIMIFLLALVLAAGGWWLVARDATQIPVQQATIDGLRMDLVQARWLLDQMDHGENFQKPSTMMPDMPEWGKQRVTVEMAFTNVGDGPRVFDGSEFFLVPEYGEEVPPMGATTGRAPLLPTQTVNTALHFDFDTSDPHGRLQVQWRRDGQVAHLPIPVPAEHYHLRPRGGEVALPPVAELLLPLGNADRGQALFIGRYGCVGCHGLPGAIGSNTVGPHLAGIGIAAQTRQEGRSAAQYIYEAIIEPDAFVAPSCPGGACDTPSSMPPYASLVNLQDAADLLTYLLEQGQP